MSQRCGKVYGHRHPCLHCPTTPVLGDGNTHDGDLVDGLFELQDVVLQVQHLLGPAAGRGELLLQHLFRLHKDPTRHKKGMVMLG